MLATIDILTTTIQHLSMVRTLDAIQALVSHAARELAEADGATFILRDGGFCWYVDEDAIGRCGKAAGFPWRAASADG